MLSIHVFLVQNQKQFWTNWHLSGGNLRHLIVEACIARKLMDTSVYFWPGYVSTSAVSLPDAAPVEKSPWLAFLEGTPLNDPLINSLIVTPASRFAM